MKMNEMLVSFPLNCKGSPWRDKISLAILEMQELGVIQQERNHWWGANNKDKLGGGDGGDSADDAYCSRVYSQLDTKASALGVDNIGRLYRCSSVGIVNF